MNRAIALLCLFVVLAGFGWTYERVNRISSRLNLASIRLDALTQAVNLENNRLQVRLFAIKSQLAQARDPIIFIGDSITEGALLPSQLCGHPVVNAGIGGETASGYLAVLRGIAVPVPLAVVAIGTNDVLASNPDFRAGYEQLLDAIPAKHLVLVQLPPMIGTGTETANQVVREVAQDRRAALVAPNFSGPDVNSADGVHLSATGYRQWLQPILESVSSQCP